jgi:phospholipid/cholesterol/gamma-HCH transport system substrate-binding protein
MRGERRVPNVAIGLVVAVVVLVAAYLAFTKNVPWGGGTEYQVVFGSGQNVRVDSPVRIAGVEVGKVTAVEPLAADASELDSETDGAAQASSTGAALVTLEIDDSGLPLKEDATFSLRPRLCLEGNLFVNVKPGSPSAPVADPGGDPFPPDRTSNSVQLDQVLTGSFQSAVRRDLQVFLDQFGNALIDGGGAESLRTLYRTSPGAFRYTSEVSEALLGRSPRDLSSLVRNLDRVVRGLGRNQGALQETVTNFRTVAGSFAAEDAALEQAIIELPQVLDAAGPAFANLNAAFPPLRALAREALPGVRSAPETLDAATPLLRQVRLLSRPRELRGLARDLVPTVPSLARLSRRTPDFLEEARGLASCFNNVVIPWSLDEVDGGPGYPHPVVGPVYKETAYGLAGIAGESRSQDANGQYIRVAGGGGPNTVTVTGEGGETLAGVTQFPIEGMMPSIGSSAKTRFRPGQPCENQDAPDLRGALGPGPTNTPVVTRSAPGAGEPADPLDDAGKALGGIPDATGRELRRLYREHGD